MPPDDKMTTADRYRALAAHLRSRASQERNLVLRGQWANLAQCYMRLAEQAEPLRHRLRIRSLETARRFRRGSGLTALSRGRGAKADDSYVTARRRRRGAGRPSPSL